jgi:hypothetical protein
MKPKFFEERGQALIIITLAAIGLFGIVGLAIDGSAKFSDRRHAQNAADTAALTGSLSLTNNETSIISGNIQQWQYKALLLADKNGYNRNLVTNQVWVGKCSDSRNDQVNYPLRFGAPVDCGPYEGLSSYVQVVINSHVNTYFARVIGIEQTHNTVSAVTLWKKEGPTYGGDLLKSLNPNPCTGDNGNIVFGGNGDVTLNGGGAYVNSGGSCGMELTGCGNLTVINGSLTSIGDGNINIETTSDTCGENLVIPTPMYNAEPSLFIPDMPDEPDECTSGPTGHWQNIGGVSYLEPGWYVEFPPKNTQAQPIYDNIVMNPGVYCVDSVVKLQENDLVLTGHDVTIYIRTGGQFDVQGGSITLDAPGDGPYAGYLIIINSDFTGTPPNCSINGDSHNVYIGTIFAPYCDFIFNGTNESGDPTLTYGTQVVAYTITLTGGSDINFTYDPGAIAWDDPQVGLLR